MAEQQIDASLDAFDALIAELVDSGEIDRSEADALAAQTRAPRTGEILIPVESAWTAARRVDSVQDAPTVQDAPAAAVAPASAAPAGAPTEAPAQPMTRREARALREAQESLREASAPDTGPIALEVKAATENQRRAEEQIRSRSVRPEVLASLPAPIPASAAPQGVTIFSKRRKGARNATAVIASLALVPALMVALPANAQSILTSNMQSHSIATDAQGRTAEQILHVGGGVQGPSVDQINYLASALANIVVTAGGEDAQSASAAIASALQVGGDRQKIVETALAYLGTPYVLGGSSFSGIDCSGLTMDAYAAIGITMPHYVPSQDLMGTRITEAEAQPGDLVVFDDEDHVGIYLGGGQILHAPAPGREVSIESVDIWKPMGIHFTRILPAGQ